MNIPERFWKTGTVAVVLLAIFLAVMSLKELKSIGYVGHNPQATNIISVDGTGDVVSKPDIATFSFTVTETAATVGAAQTKATDKINSALKAVKDSGVKDNDVSTNSYSINPHYEYQQALCPANGICRPGKQVLAGYDVSQSIQVKVRDLDKAGALFTSIGSLNVQNVDALSFSIDKPESLKAQARGLAIADAQAKAKDLAKQLGVTLMRVVSFTESNDRNYPTYYSMGKVSAAMDVAVPAAVPQIPAGDQKITKNVTISYEIE